MSEITTINGNNLRDSRMDNFSADLQNIATAIGNLAPKENEINLLDMYPIGSVYFSVEDKNPSLIFGGVWEKIGSKLAVRENVFGNGKTLGMAVGGTLTGLQCDSHGNDYVYGIGRFGSDKGTGYTNNRCVTEVTVGLATKAECGTSPQNSGLIVDTETIYSYKRIA